MQTLDTKQLTTVCQSAENEAAMMLGSLHSNYSRPTEITISMGDPSSPTSNGCGEVICRDVNFKSESF